MAKFGITSILGYTNSITLFTTDKEVLEMAALRVTESFEKAEIIMEPEDSTLTSPFSFRVANLINGDEIALLIVNELLGDGWEPIDFHLFFQDFKLVKRYD